MDCEGYLIISLTDSLYLCVLPGGPLVFQVGYHPRKRTFKTHPKHVFSGMKIDPKYAFLHAFFFNLSVMSLPKFVI